MSDEEKELYKKVKEYQKKIDNIEWEHFPFKDIPKMPSSAFKSSLQIMEFRQLFSQSTYPQERLPKLFIYFQDFFTQLMMIRYPFFALYNYYDLNIKPGKHEDTQDLYEVYFLQSFILMSKILFERIMNFIYFLEKGKDLEIKKKSGKTARFFQSIKNTPWEFLRNSVDFIKKFDESLRTPEAHKHSLLNKQFRENTISDRANIIFSDVIHFHNKVENEILQNLRLILQGQPPTVRFEQTTSDQRSVFFRPDNKEILI